MAAKGREKKSSLRTSKLNVIRTLAVSTRRKNQIPAAIGKTGM